MLLVTAGSGCWACSAIVDFAPLEGKLSLQLGPALQVLSHMRCWATRALVASHVLLVMAVDGCWACSAMGCLVVFGEQRVCR